MSNMVRALSYLMAANIQAIGLFIFAYWLGKKLNIDYPRDFSWKMVTIPCALLASIQVYYLVIRQTIILDKQSRAEKERADSES